MQWLMQRVEEDTYVGHFPAELFPGSQQLRHHRPHVRQREELLLKKGNWTRLAAFSDV